MHVVRVSSALTFLHRRVSGQAWRVIGCPTLGRHINQLPEIYLRGVLVGQNKLTMVTLESRRERSSSETRYCEPHARIANVL